MRLFDLHMHLILLIVFLPSAASEDTRFAFRSFSAADENISAFGDAAHHVANRSYIINGRATHMRGSCGAMFYNTKVRIQDVATGRVASFRTSFSFTFNSLGFPRVNSTSKMAFIIISSAAFAETQAFLSAAGQSGACRTSVHPIDTNTFYYPSSVSVSLGMPDHHPSDKVTNNSYILAGKNLAYEYDIGAYLHNLCSHDMDTHCSYFPDGNIFTAWMDFNGSSWTLEVRLAHGSDPSVKKPLQPRLRIPNYKLPELLGDEVYLSIWGSSAINCVEAHELFSWSFFSSEISPSSRTLFGIWKARTWDAGSSTGVWAAVVVAAVVILWFISRLARPSLRSYRHTALGRSAGPHVFSYAELRTATQNFDERNLLGKGGSGSVYKGCFETPGGSQVVAVKQIDISQSKQAESLFHAEVASLGQIRHRNVVQLLGWCQEKGRLMLVYDFMPNGALSEWLHASGSQEFVLSLKMRHAILEEVGAAVEYLHEDCLSCILHRDIKSSNVLLDATFKAHLGDFGLARLTDHHKLDITTLAAGTLGYMAPEMPYTGKATKESDVYSFGILVLEVISGRRPLDMQASKPEDLVLLHTIWRAHEDGSLFNLVDSRLLQTLQPSRFLPHLEDEVITHAMGPPLLPLNCDKDSDKNVLGTKVVVDVDVEVYATMVVDLLRLGLLCCLPNPKARPSMGQVNGMLQQIRDMVNLSSITSIVMPFLPTTKPLGLFHSLEFSQTSLSLSSSNPPLSEAHTKLTVQNSTSEQAFDNFHKDE